MNQENAVAAIAHVIQLAVAPVFLLSGIGAVLAVMTNRLARIIDRARVLQSSLAGSAVADEAVIHDELGILKKRAKIVSIAIGLCTGTALLISAVIAVLFLGAFLGFDASLPVALLFVAAMVAFSVALLCFLREIMLATKVLRFYRL